MFNLRRLKFLLKRKDKRFKSDIEPISVTDGTIIDTSNYSDTLYNIVCSIKNIPCDVNTRTLDFYKQLESIDDNSIVDMTNSIIIIYYDTISNSYFEFINHLNRLCIRFNTDKDKIIISLSIYDTESLCNSNLDNEFMNKCRVLSNLTFNTTLYNDSTISDNNNCIDHHHEYKLSSDNDNPMMLPLKDNDTKYHIYVLENQLLNFLESNLSDGFDFTEISSDIMTDMFIIIICFDNFNSYEYELKEYSKYYINQNSNRIICKYYISDLIQLISLFEQHKNEEEAFVLYNFFLTTYTKCLEVLNNKYDHNIQINSLEDSNTDFLEGIDEII